MIVYAIPSFDVTCHGKVRNVAYDTSVDKIVLTGETRYEIHPEEARLLAECIRKICDAIDNVVGDEE